jgi:RND family efflux transporter MFP subunit
MESQIAEAQSKAQAVELQRAEAVAKLSSVSSTYERLKSASATPGVVAGNDLTVAEKSVEAAQALVNAYEGSIKAAQASVQSLKAMEKYLTISAPFDGIITERAIHPGTLVGPNSGMGAQPLLGLEQVNRLRLVVAVPETQVGGIVKNARVHFTVAAFPGETFFGVVSRLAHALDPKTRTMSVELEVTNPGLRLASGMYPEVLWPVRKNRPALLVPPTSIVTTTERAFVIRIKDDVAGPVSAAAKLGDQIGFDSFVLAEHHLETGHPEAADHSIHFNYEMVALEPSLTGFVLSSPVTVSRSRRPLTLPSLVYTTLTSRFPFSNSPVTNTTSYSTPFSLTSSVRLARRCLNLPYCIRTNVNWS